LKGILHHIELYVSDLEKSKNFWGWLLVELGYEKYQEWNNGISFKLEDTYLVFVQTEDKYLDLKYHRKTTGLNHLAFHLNSHEMLNEFTQKLKERDISILYEEKHPFSGGKEHYAVFFEDPDRIKVELVG
jgi:catechol 2,3-dioxygenase-like lactoylglutathione lyase family enzyme